MLRKKLRKYGGSLVIVLDKEDKELYNLKEGDLVDLSDITKVKKRLNNAQK